MLRFARNDECVADISQIYLCHLLPLRLDDLEHARKFVHQAHQLSEAHRVARQLDLAGGKIKFTGNAMRLGELMDLMDDFPRMFEIVEPKRTVVS